jgi:hypothetical protein
MSRDLHHTRARMLWSALLGAAFLGACSDGTTLPSDTTSVVQQDALDMGAASADETELAIDALGSADDAVAMSLSSTATNGSLLAIRRPLCATVSATTDTDGDGIRDNTAFTYALPACSFTNWRGGSVELTGVISVSDPDPAPSFAYLLAYDSFRWQYTAPNTVDSWSATRNGSRTLTASSAQLSLSNQVSIVRTFARRADATVAHNTLLVFTPDAGSELVRGNPLPSGSAVKSGQVTFSRNGNVRTFTVNTVTPLRFDASCTVAPRVSAGEIHYELSDGSYVEVLWSACGVPAVRTWVPVS